MANQPVIVFHFWFPALLFFPVIIYAATIIIFTIFGLAPDKRTHFAKPMVPLPVSILVAARNEPETIQTLLEDIAGQDYPQELIHVIIVDDHSEIRIHDLPLLTGKYLFNLKILELEEHNRGKKKALLKGAEVADSDLLIFTDADCRLPAEWIKGHIHAFTEKNSDLTIGLTKYAPCNKLFQALFCLDIMSLNLCSAASASLQHPVMCSGANLSVKRDLYLELADKLRPDVPSGDDIFLLHEVKKLKEKQICILKNRSSIVSTLTPSSVKEFLNQRARWVSKSKHYTDRETIFLAVLVFLSNLSVLFSLLGLVVKHNPELFVSILCIKIIADSLLLAIGYNYYHTLKYFFLVPLFEVIYPFYILTSIVKGYLNLFSWKNRTFSEATEPR